MYHVSDHPKHSYVLNIVLIIFFMVHHKDAQEKTRNNPANLFGY